MHDVLRLPMTVEQHDSLIMAMISPEGAEPEFQAAWMRTMTLYYSLPNGAARKMARQGLELLQDVLCAMWGLGEGGEELSGE